MASDPTWPAAHTWIVGGMALLGLGAVGASVSTALMAQNLWLGVALATLSFTAIGLGVGASGTTMLVLMSKRVDEARLPAAATVTWVMMILGFISRPSYVGRALSRSVWRDWLKSQSAWPWQRS